MATVDAVLFGTAAADQENWGSSTVQSSDDVIGKVRLSASTPSVVEALRMAEQNQESFVIRAFVKIQVSAKVNRDPNDVWLPIERLRVDSLSNPGYVYS